MFSRTMKSLEQTDASSMPKIFITGSEIRDAFSFEASPAPPPIPSPPKSTPPRPLCEEIRHSDFEFRAHKLTWSDSSECSFDLPSRATCALSSCSLSLSRTSSHSHSSEVSISVFNDSQRSLTGKSQSVNRNASRPLPEPLGAPLDVENSISFDELTDKKENRMCADCREKDADWVSINLGVFVCMTCAGIHRSLGTQYSKIRSVHLDSIRDQPAVIQFLRRWGNSRARAIFEARLPRYILSPASSASDGVRANFIYDKYVRRSFVRFDDAQPDETDGLVNVVMPEPLVDGFLMKSHPRGRKWQKRWFVLHGSSLIYFKNVSDSWPAGTIPLRAADIRPSDLSVGVGFAFAVETRARSYMVAAETEDDRIRWIHALRRTSICYTKRILTDKSPTADEKVERSLSKIGRMSLDVSEFNRCVEDSRTVPPLRNIAQFGSFMKQGGEYQSWKRRFFVLEDGILHYYKQVQTLIELRENPYQEPTGSIPMAGAQLITDATVQTGRPWAFGLVAAGRQYFFGAPTAAGRKQWLRPLGECARRATEFVTVDFCEIE
eukprot:351329_1